MHVHEPFPAHLRTVGHAREDVFACELRVLFQDLFDGETQGEQVQGDARVLSSYSLCVVEFEDGLIEPLDHSMLPVDWRSYLAPSGLREIGDAWVKGGPSVILEVPSAVVERESNYLINPAHPDFVSVNVGELEPFEFDSRLL